MAELDAGPTASQKTTRGRWVPDVSDAEVIRFCIWLALVLMITVASTAAVIRLAEAHAGTHRLGTGGLWWAIATAASILFLSILGGFFVFRPPTPWQVVATWPSAGGIVVGLGYYFTLSAMGQTEPGSALCGRGPGCDIAFGFGAAVLALSSGVILASLFIGAHGVARLATTSALRSQRRRRRRATRPSPNRRTRGR